MSTNDGSVGAEVSVLTEANQSFLADSVSSDLKSLLLALKRASKGAVDTLVRIMGDDKVDPKVQVAAAKAVLDAQVDVASKITTDQIQRLIAEIKLNRGVLNSTQLVEDDSKPVVNFTEIRAV